MKNLLIWVVFGGLILASCHKDESDNTKNLTDEEKSGLIFTRQEEKLAYDVYRYAFEKYGSPVFDNISRSEATHQSKIQDILDEYGIQNPVENLGAGQFADENLQNLYYQLIEKVNISLADDFEVGATIEDLDINDLMGLSESSQNIQIKKTYEMLTCGSRNHLRGFTGQLKNLGKDYVPQFLSADLYAAIISGSHENCGQ